MSVKPASSPTLIHCCAIGKNEFDSTKKKRQKQFPAAATVVVDYRRGGVAMKQCIHGTQVFDVIPPSMAGSTMAGSTS